MVNNVVNFYKDHPVLALDVMLGTGARAIYQTDKRVLRNPVLQLISESLHISLFSTLVAWKATYKLKRLLGTLLGSWCIICT